MTDRELLHQYFNGQHGAMEALIRRHIDMVCATARRRVGEAHADDVTQAVFVILLRRCRSLVNRESIAGWLYRTTVYCCENVQKVESRRRRHEQGSSPMGAQEASIPEPSDVQELRELLDSGLAALNSHDREAVLLHHLEQKNYTEAGQHLGISEEAARKRADRGVAKLRHFFARRGYAVPAASVAAMLGKEACAAAPSATVTATLATANGAAIPVAVSAMAKTVIAMLWSAQAKLAAALVLCSLIVGASTVVLMSAGSASGRRPRCPWLRRVQRAPDPWGMTAFLTTLPTPDSLALVRWDAFVEQAVAEQVRTTGNAVTTTSQGYTARDDDWEKVLTLLRKERAQGRYINAFAQRYYGPWAEPTAAGRPRTAARGLIEQSPSRQIRAVRPEDVGTANYLAQIESAGNGIYVETAPTGGLAVEFDHVTYQLGYEKSTRKGTLEFNGALGPGHTLVFIGTALEPSAPDGMALVHLAGFQCVVYRADEAPLLAKLFGDDLWVYDGTDRLRAVARRALAWQKAAAAQVADAAWRRPLDGDTTLTLAQVSAPEQYPLCWWDPKGEPVRVSEETRVTRHTGYLARMESLRDQTPTAHLMCLSIEATARRADGTLETWDEQAFLPVGTKTFRAGTGVGSWHDAANIQLGQTVKVGAMQYTLQRFAVDEASDPHHRMALYLDFVKGDPDVDVRLIAVKKNRERVEQTTEPDVSGMPRPILLSPIMIEGASGVPSNYFGRLSIAPQDVETFIIQTRPRAWTEFKDFALQPNLGGMRR